MRGLRRISFLGLVLLAGCGRPQSTAVSPQVPASESGAVSSIAALAVPGRPAYTLYNARYVGKGQSSLLFFSQNSDPFSAQSDLNLRKLYASGSAAVSTYRLDFGSETGARFSYGVIVPDTFVLLGSSGERKTSIIHPQEEELKALLK